MTKHMRMKIENVLNYLREKHGIIYYQLTQFNDIHIADLVIKAPRNSFGLKTLHSSGSHHIKDVAILKSTIEMVERIVFISPIVGPIDFIDGKVYIIDIKGEPLNISRVSPYFTNEAQFNTKGHACHILEREAKLLAELEHYEKLILNNLEKYVDNCTQENNEIDFSTLIKEYGIQYSCINNLDALLIAFDHFSFSAVWSITMPGYIIGSSCGKDKNAALYKAFLEANSKLEMVTKNKCSIIEVAEKRIFDIKPGFYLHANAIVEPKYVKRHNQVLTDLDLFMYQAV